jgi:CRP/FNR family transcriptional regulator, cyclic AMP receptor protein
MTANLSPTKDLSDAARVAWEHSFLADVSPAVSRELLATAWESRLVAGDIFYRGSHHADMAMLGVVASGQLRIFLRSAGGRQATVRYVEAGAVVGIPAVLMGGGHIDGQVMVDATILRLSPTRFCELAQRDGSLSFAIARFLAEQLSETQEILAADLFMDVRARVARHMLDLAIRDADGRLVVLVNHQTVADAVGSVREVVSRVIKRMQSAGVIERNERLMIIRDPAALHAIAMGKGG